MTSLSELETNKTHQADSIITTYPSGDFTYVTSASTILTKRYSYDEVNKQLSRSETIFPEAELLHVKMTYLLMAYLET